MKIRDIQLRKYNEAKKAKEKSEREDRPPNRKILEQNEEEKDPAKMTEEEIYAKKLKDQESGDDQFMTDAQKLEAAEKKEREEYGRFWMWEGYFNEKNKTQWLETAEALKHINEHVLKDIEDRILLQGFKGMPLKETKNIIDGDTRERIVQNKKLMKEGGEEYYERESRHMKKRKDLNVMRPPEVWNFFDDAQEEEKTSHILRANANPEKCYIDGRIELILKNLEEIAMNLSKYEEPKWRILRKHTLEIFAHEYDAFSDKLKQAGN